MMNVLLAGYCTILALFVWLKWIPFNTFWKVSPLVVAVLLVVGLFIPMSWGAPQGPAVVVRNSVQIVPSVSGEVVDVSVSANQPLKSGAVLFRIDPVPYRSQVDALQAQLKLAQQRLGQATRLAATGAGATTNVEQHQAEVDQLAAQLIAAKYNLERTTVRAPADGYVTHLTLRRGARVNDQSPVMAFIDTADTLVGAEIEQINTRYIKEGQPVEVTFKTFPGEVYTGKVETLLQAVATGQTQSPSGTAVAPSEIRAVPFVVRIKLDDDAFAARLPAGTTGAAAIYTDHVKIAHVIRKVMLRQTAILNYFLPF